MKKVLARSAVGLLMFGLITPVAFAAPATGSNTGTTKPVVPHTAPAKHKYNKKSKAPTTSKPAIAPVKTTR